MKNCSKCKETKEEIEFSKCKKNKDGYSYYCKKCVGEWFLSKPNYQKNYYIKNREKRKLLYQSNNPIFIKKTKEQVKKHNANYYKQKRNNNPLFKLICNIRTRTYQSLKRKSWKKTSKNKELLGCDFDYLKLHIEQQFTEGMNWENYGKWHIDHKIPLDNANTKEDLFKLCHYTNLQPLWALDNLKKGAKVF